MHVVSLASSLPLCPFHLYVPTVICSCFLVLVLSANDRSTRARASTRYSTPHSTVCNTLHLRLLTAACRLADAACRIVTAACRPSIPISMVAFSFHLVLPPFGSTRKHHPTQTPLACIALACMTSGPMFSRCSSCHHSG